MTALQQALVNWAVAIANDNRYHYYYYYQGDSNLGPWGFDCATYNSYTIYKAMGWTDWPSTSHGGIGYFWPHINDEQYGAFDFLTYNGWQQYRYSSSLLTEGAIIVCDETLGHSLMYIGNNQLCDANDFGGTDFGDNSIAVRPFPYYDPAHFYYIFLPPDVPPGPGPGPLPGLYSPRTFIRRRGLR